MPEPPPAPDWEALYDSAPCGLMATGADGHVRRANATVCHWLGRSAQDLAGLRLQDLLTAGGRIFLQTHIQPLLQMQGSVSEVKLDLRRADGGTVPVVLNVVRREDGPHGPGVVHEFALFIAEDRNAYERELVVARKRAEQLAEQQRQAHEALVVAQARLTTAVEAGALHVWEAELETGHREFAPGVALLLGRAAPGPVSAEEYRAAIEPEDLERAREALGHVLVDTTRTYTANWRLNGEDGVQRTVLATARGVVDPDGRIRRAVGVMQDITELARQRTAAEDRALFAEQMVGIVSHDLRNPLSAIRLGAQALQLGASPGQINALVGSIQRASDRASRLIADLLDFTRARIGGGLRVEERRIDVHAVVHAQLDELRAAHPGVAIEHHREGDPGDEGCLGDPDRLAQLLGNLVSNAVAYGTPGKPVTVTTVADCPRWSIAVHNWGPVLAPEVRETLFQPMVRGTDVGDARRSVGLGLYIVAEIARAHGARVSVESTAANGTEFKVAVSPQRTR